uniref:Uncharacterized protein n=1 Tax=Oryza sativa subsp. japonica TaxID=39947 RepID=Q6K2N2_ORYSJ|nr:hypothetical protein [Oryza sativa Japonica Group]
MLSISWQCGAHVSTCRISITFPKDQHVQGIVMTCLAQGLGGLGLHLDLQLPRAQVSLLLPSFSPSASPFLPLSRLSLYPAAQRQTGGEGSGSPTAAATTTAHGAAHTAASWRRRGGSKTAARRHDDGDAWRRGGKRERRRGWSGERGECWAFIGEREDKGEREEKGRAVEGGEATAAM